MSARAGEMIVFLVATAVMLVAGLAAWSVVEVTAGALAVVAALGVCDIL